MHNHCLTGERCGQFLRSILFLEMVRLIYLLIFDISCFDFRQALHDFSRWRRNNNAVGNEKNEINWQEITAIKNIQLNEVVYFYLLFNNCMCRRWQLEVTMILVLDIRKEKQHLTNYKVHGTDNPKQSFEVRNMWYDYTDNIWIRDLLINSLKDNFGQTLIPVKLLLTVVKMSRDPFVNTSFCLYQSISNNIKR